jgi:hypothetical protein
VRSAFEYAIVRVVPRVEREEFMNAGVVLWCERREVLRARVALDEARLRAFAPSIDLALVRSHLAALESICDGAPGSGPIGELAPRERFSWIVSPRSTIVQTSEPHVGVAEDLDAALERILARVVHVL